MKDANGPVAVWPVMRRTRGSRFGKATAAAGLLVGALLLGGRSPGPRSCIRRRRPRRTRKRARRIRRIRRAHRFRWQPTRSRTPSAGRSPIPPCWCRRRMSPRRHPPNPALDAGPGGAGRTGEGRPRTGGRTWRERHAIRTDHECRPAAALSEPSRPEENTPPAPALDLPVQALSVPAVKTAPAAVDPSTGSVAPVTLPSPAPAAHTAAPAPAAPARRAEADAAAVRGVLEGYASVYSALDAEATQHLWPGGDLRGLRRAFEQLSAQTVLVRPMRREAGGRLGRGRMRGSHHLGAPSRRSVAALRRRTWQFALARDGNDWLIERVQVKR